MKSPSLHPDSSDYLDGVEDRPSASESHRQVRVSPSNTLELSTVPSPIDRDSGKLAFVFDD